MSRYDIITFNALWIEVLNSDGGDGTGTEVKVVDRVNQWRRNKVKKGQRKADGHTL